MTVSDQEYVRMMLSRKAVHEKHIGEASVHWAEIDTIDDFDRPDPLVLGMGSLLLSELKLAPGSDSNQEEASLCGACPVGTFQDESTACEPCEASECVESASVAGSFSDDLGNAASKVANKDFEIVDSHRKVSTTHGPGIMANLRKLFCEVQDQHHNVHMPSLNDNEDRNVNGTTSPGCGLMDFEVDDAPSSRPSFRADVYVAGLVHYTGCSPSCLAMGMVYLQRLKQSFEGARVTRQNFQRLILVATLTAAKISDDFRFSNKFWAKVAGIQLQELNKLELRFLSLIGWKLHVTKDEYDAAARTLYKWVGEDFQG